GACGPDPVFDDTDSSQGHSRRGNLVENGDPGARSNVAVVAPAIIKFFRAVRAEHQCEASGLPVLLARGSRGRYDGVEWIDTLASDKRCKVQVHQDDIDVAALIDRIQDFRGDAAAVLLQRAHRRVDRIADAGPGAQLQRLKLLPGGLREGRYLDPLRSELIGREHAHPAAIAEQCQAAYRPLRLQTHELQGDERIKKPIHVRDDDSRSLRGQSAPRAIVVRQRPRVRRRRDPALRRTAALHQDDRLAGFALAEQIKKATAILHVFQIEPDDAGGRIIEVELQKIGRRYVRAIPDRHESAESETTDLTTLDDIGA